MSTSWYNQKNKFKEVFTIIKTLDQALLLLEKAYKKCGIVEELSLAFDTPVDIITKYLMQLGIFNKKWCSKCNDGDGAWCDRDQFSKNSGHIDGLNSNCKSCDKSYKKQYDSKSEARKEYQKEYNSRPETIEARKEYLKEYKSRPEIRDRNNALYRERYNTDIAFRIRNIISSRIYESLKVNNTSKMNESVSDYLPYTIQELMDHLELQFLPGMTWDNHALFGWHIDHKKPISKFKITSMECEEFQECWALKNLQPLWWQENLAKSNYYEEPEDNEDEYDEEFLQMILETDIILES